MATFFGRVLIPDATSTVKVAQNESLVLANAALSSDYASSSAAAADPHTTLQVRVGATQPWLSLCALSTATRQWSLGGLTFGGGASGTSVAFRAEGAGTVHLAGHVTGAAAALASPGAATPATAPAAAPRAAPTAAAAAAPTSSKKRPRAEAPREEPAATPAPAAEPKPPAAKKKEKEAAGVKAKKSVVFDEAAKKAPAAPAASVEASDDDDDDGEEDGDGDDGAAGGEAKKRPTKRQRKKAAKEAARAGAARDAEGGAVSGKIVATPGMGIAVKNPKTRHLGGGLTVKDTVMGSGPAAPLGRTVKILYEGSLAADGSVFDKRENKRSPLGFRLGLREVVPGMDKGLEGMKVGGCREIHVPSSMGYKDKRTGPIPPNSDLIFKVELIQIG